MAAFLRLFVTKNAWLLEIEHDNGDGSNFFLLCMCVCVLESYVVLTNNHGVAYLFYTKLTIFIGSPIDWPMFNSILKKIPHQIMLVFKTHNPNARKTV